MLASGSGDILEAAKVLSSGGRGHCPYQPGAGDHGARPRCGEAKSITPEAAARRLRAASHEGVRTAILFGGERAGLDNDEMSLADAVDHHSDRGILVPQSGPGGAADGL